MSLFSRIFRGEVGAADDGRVAGTSREDAVDALRVGWEPGPVDLDDFRPAWRAATALNAVRLRIGPGEPGLLDSKLGGQPYLPPGADWPRAVPFGAALSQPGSVPLASPAAAGDQVETPRLGVETPRLGFETPGLEARTPGRGVEIPGLEAEPLFLLAQLNLAQLPPLAGFPTKGIIQFFIAAGDTHGMDFADFTQGAGHAVLYWPDAPAVNDGLDYHPDTPDLAAPIADLAVPFVTQRAVKLVGEVSPTALSLADFRFASQADRLVMTEPGRWPVLEAWRRAPANAALSPADLEDDSARGHRLGGHPWFTVDDPRSRPVYTGFTTLLLQLDTDDEAGLAWGERGVCHFFIEPERLAALDFSCVLYHWDSC